MVASRLFRYPAFMVRASHGDPWTKPDTSPFRLNLKGLFYERRRGGWSGRWVLGPGISPGRGAAAEDGVDLLWALSLGEREDGEELGGLGVEIPACDGGGAACADAF